MRVAFSFMQLSLTDLLPDYFSESRKQSSEIWGKDLCFSKGELISIVAPSGSGKTSLVHFLYGLRRDYKGSVAFDEKRLNDYGPEDLALLRAEKVSIVLQDLRLLSEQTVYENLYIKHQLKPFHPEERLTDMARRLGIGDKLSSKTKNCSYGEQQRVAIIRALLQPFDFLLLDEPFSHLDRANAERAMSLILEEAKARNAAIIFAELERLDYFPSNQLYHL